MERLKSLQNLNLPVGYFLTAMKEREQSKILGT